MTALNGVLVNFFFLLSPKQCSKTNKVYALVLTFYHKLFKFFFAHFTFHLVHFSRWLKMGKISFFFCYETANTLSVSCAFTKAYVCYFFFSAIVCSSEIRSCWHTVDGTKKKKKLCHLFRWCRIKNKKNKSEIEQKRSVFLASSLLFSI